MKIYIKLLVSLLVFVLFVPSIAQTEQNLTPAQMGQLAWDYSYGENGKTQNFSEAAKWAQQAANSYDAKGMHVLAICHYLGQSVPQSYTKAAKWFRKAADQGFATSQYNLGLLYMNGEGVEQSYSEAAQLFRKAAEQGDPMGQAELGSCYLHGQGVLLDFAEAVKWFRKAAEQGDSGSQCNLGICYDNGLGVQQSYSEAAKWYIKAAEAGQPVAQFNLGYCYLHGQGVQQNFEEGFKWTKKAAENGNVRAQYNLACCYYTGEGVEENIELAMKWFNIAANNNNEDAINALNILSAHETNATLAQAANNGFSNNHYNVNSSANNGPINGNLPPRPLAKRQQNSPLAPLGNSSIGSSDGESFSERAANAIGETFRKVTEHATSVLEDAARNSSPMAGYPYLSASFGASRMFGEFVRLKACLGGYAGYQFYGGIGKDWLFNGKNKKKTAWHVGLGYYIATDEDKEFSIGVTYSETPVHKGGALGFDTAFTYFPNKTHNRIGIFGGIGLGLGNLKEAFESDEDEKFLGVFVWDISVGISIKLFANKHKY